MLGSCSCMFGIWLGVMLVSFRCIWGHVGVVLVLLCCYIDVMLGSFGGHFGAMLVPCGFILGSMLA